jgi:hypothetical protein
VFVFVFVFVFVRVRVRVPVPVPVPGRASGGCVVARAVLVRRLSGALSDVERDRHGGASELIGDLGIAAGHRF